MKKLFVISSVVLFAVVAFFLLVDVHININIGDANTKSPSQNQTEQILDSVYTTADCFTCLAAAEGAVSDTAQLKRSATDEALIKIVRKTNGENLLVSNDRYVHKIQEYTKYKNDNQVVCYAQVTLYKKEK